MNYTCWINADDEEIDICEMDNEYIKNCIQMYNKKAIINILRGKMQ